jgi:WD40 repeat protein
MNRFGNSTVPNDLITVHKKEDLPGDTVSKISWSPSNNFVLGCSCWDGTLRVYEAISEANNAFMVQVLKQQFDAPLTAFAWGKNLQQLVVGTADGRVLAFDANKLSSSPITKHNNAVRELIYDEQNDIIISIDCDTTVRFSTFASGETNMVTVQYKIHCGAFKYRVLVLALSHNKLGLLNLNSDNPEMNYLDSPLESPVSSVCFGDNKEDFFAGTIDGRIGHLKIDYPTNYRPNHHIKSSLIFKAHKEPPENNTSKPSLLYPINDIISERRQHEYVVISCAGNRKICMWGLNNKSKFRELTMPDGVTSISMHPKQNMLVVATGYDWSEGVWGTGKVGCPPGLYIYNYKPEDFRPTD